MLTDRKIRLARPSDDLEAPMPFDRDGLGLAVLGRFEDPDGCRVVIQGVAWDA